jgi:hypothetical protein
MSRSSPRKGHKGHEETRVKHLIENVNVSCVSCVSSRTVCTKERSRPSAPLKSAFPFGSTPRDTRDTRDTIEEYQWDRACLFVSLVSLVCRVMAGRCIYPTRSPNRAANSSASDIRRSLSCICGLGG